MRRLVLIAALGCNGGSGPDVTVEAAGAVLAAYQDGDGPWQPLAIDANGVGGFENPAGYYGVAVFCIDPIEMVSFVYSTERTTPLPCPRRLGLDSFTLRGSTAAGAEIWAESSPVFVEGTQYETSLREGTHDIFALLPPRILIARDVVMSADRTLDLPVDTEGVDMVSITPSIRGADPGDVILYADVNTGERSDYTFLGEFTTSVLVPPASVLLPRDRVSVGARSGNCSTQEALADSVELVIPAPFDASIDRAAVSWSADRAVAWDVFAVTLRVGLALIQTRARFDWIEARGAGEVLPIVDPTTIPGWTPELPGAIAAGTTVDADTFLVRGQYDGDYDSCGLATTFTW